MGNRRRKTHHIDHARREFDNDPQAPIRALDRKDLGAIPSDCINLVPKKPGRKPMILDLSNYCCPRCKTKPAEKSKHKNLCRTCYNADYNARTKKWYAEHRSKGYGKRGRPTGPPPDRDTLCPVSASWLSRPITPSRADPT